MGIILNSSCFAFFSYWWSSNNKNTLFWDIGNQGKGPNKLTSDGELSGGVSQRNELLLAPVVVDNDVHGVGAQRDVICTDGQGGGGAVCHLPVLTCQMSNQSLVSTYQIHCAASSLQISIHYFNLIHLILPGWNTKLCVWCVQGQSLLASKENANMRTLVKWWVNNKQLA